MNKKFEIKNLNLQPGMKMEIEGVIPPAPKHFIINLGQDYDNIGCHFNARFNRFHDRNIVVCNSKREDGWDGEQREIDFPFQPGTQTKICFYFEKTAFHVTLPNGHEIEFTNRLNLDTIRLLQIKDDFELKSLTFN